MVTILLLSVNKAISSKTNYKYNVHTKTATYKDSYVYIVHVHWMEDGGCCQQPCPI